MRRHSDSVAKIAKALLAAQRQIDGVAKDGTNPFHKSRYATLPDVIEAVKGALNDAGIVISQAAFAADNGIGIQTTLLHESGEWISDELVMPLAKADPQGAGSAITYGRRYGLSALVGLRAVDDDAELACGRAKAAAAETAKPQPVAAAKPNTKRLAQLIADRKVADAWIDAWLMSRRVLSWDLLTQDEVDALCKDIEAGCKPIAAAKPAAQPAAAEIF